ncbi:LacI family DNA-binding transcriptional regulator [Salsipaludibacter albus]|uniref:LacI family DNA-binding transcriptional regulator n=1 Tax=Salsipaludibacter albus TaxID=2849650 RepID=UPI0023678B78|nr:LacI family DNA-binding transcriptional regulator [Salsipaludibacter albus]MBY5164258.1 LacI family transcriptional regulator [Salsipaludibacter albus]
MSVTQQADAGRTDRVTIGDVAERAGVSVATVSRVVNDRYGVSRETTERVRKVIDELGYASSLVAQGMRSQRTGVIGVLMSRIEPFGTEILKAVSESLQDSGHELIVFCPASEHAEGWERRSLARLGDSLVDGALLVAPTVVDVSTDRPLVAVDPHVGASHLSTVSAENHEGALAATRHLVEIGHRRIGFLGGRQDLESSRQRETGYRRALMDAGIDFDPTLVQHGDFTEAGAVAPARQLLALSDRPTAIFAANDRSALSLVRTADELGLRVPDDLSVVGFDNIPEAAQATPPLTTVDQSLHALGRAAITMLLELIDRDGPGAEEPVHHTLPTELVLRRSTAPPGNPDRTEQR